MVPQQPKGKIVGFKPLEEKFSYYALDDGTILGVKPVIVKVYRLENPDGTPAFAPDGSPLYFYQTQNVTQTLTYEEYKQLSKGEIEK